MSPKVTRIIVVGLAIMLGVYFALQPLALRTANPPPPPTPKHACTINAECTVRGRDEWERCHHVTDPFTDDQVATGAKDATSKTQDGYACMCVAKTCQWAGKDYQACVNTGGKFSRREDCPACPTGAICEACFTGCQCPPGKTFDISAGCR